MYPIWGEISTLHSSNVFPMGRPRTRAYQSSTSMSQQTDASNFVFSNTRRKQSGIDKWVKRLN